ncbi:MAG: endonuclease/exonuclease/phosphatase family protein [Bacteroidota bacterium]
MSLTVCVSSVHAQDTVRVATYNILNYPGGDAATRNPHFRAVMYTTNPDVLVVQEMQSSAGVTQFRDNVLNSGQPGMYTSVTFNDGPDTDNALFYKSSEVAFLGATYIVNSPRTIAEYRFKPVGSPDTVRLYSVHLKANVEDSLDRLAEAITLRNYLNALPAGTKFIVAGDFNIYRSTEPAFQKLIVSEADNDGRSKDPLNAIGTWNNNFAFRGIHTQSTRIRAFGTPSTGSTGGLDDRFDMLLVSYPMESHLLLSTYTPYGNDGNHFNDSINQLPNTAVADSVANGLHYGSDHLPVFADFVFGTSEPDTGFVSIASGNWNTPGIWSGGVVPTGTSPVTVATGTTVTIDGTTSCATIAIAGTLQCDATTGRSLDVNGNLVIQSGGEMRASSTSATGSTTQVLTVGGNFTNNGTFTPRQTTSGTRVMNVTFDGTTNATIGGTTSPTDFNVLTMSLSTPSKVLTPLININIIGTNTNPLALNQGTWAQNAGSTSIINNLNMTVASNAVLAIGGGSLTTIASLIVNGALDVSGGTLTVGSGNNRVEIASGAIAEFSGGTTNIGGRLLLLGGTTDITGGAVSVNPRGSADLSPVNSVVDVRAAASMTMTDGSLTVVNPRTSTLAAYELQVVSGAGAKNFSGGTIYLGNGVSTFAGTDTGFVIESGVTLPNMVIRTGGGTGKDVALASALTVRGLELESGTLKLASPFASGFDLTVSGDLMRSAGVLSPGTRTVTLSQPAPAEQTSVSSGFTGANTLHHLTINNPSGVTLGGNMEVNGTLAVVNGSLEASTSTVTLGPSATLSEADGQTVIGRISATRNVAQSVNNAFGGIGLEINADGAVPGSTTVIRTTGIAFTSGFASSIERSFDILPALNSGLDARIRFFYDDTEIDGQQSASLRLWHSEDSAATWTLAGGTVDTALRRIELTGVDSFSVWTASDSANPLSQFSVNVTLTNGWNAVSVPVGTPQNSVQELFPLCPPFIAYNFIGSAGYQQQSTMERGIGYWVKCSGGNVQLTGTQVLDDTIVVVTGWNLIGSISVSVDTATIVQVPSGILSSQFFEYTGTYNAAASIEPGKAYWVKAGAPGVLVMQGSTPELKKKTSRIGSSTK